MSDQPETDLPDRAVGGFRLRAAHLGLLLVWIVAAAPVVLWFVQTRDPELAVRLAATGWQWLGRVGLAAAVLGIAALLYPPFPAWLRLSAHRTRLSLTNDRGALQRALGELRHFESGPRHLEVGRLALAHGDRDAARRHLQRAVELDPGLAGAHHQLGRLLFLDGTFTKALDAFTRAESVDPGHAFGDALLHGGRCLHLTGDTTRAADVLRLHAQRHGGGRRSAFWLGEALAANGDAMAAREAFRAAAAPPPARQRLTAEENWFRARARVRLWGRGGSA